MKKTLLLAIATAIFAVGATAGTLPSALIRPHGMTQSLSLNDGSGNMGTVDISGGTTTFSFDMILTYAGYNSTGNSIWLEAANGIAPFLSITGMTYGTTFPDPTQTQPNPAFFATGSTGGASPGFMIETRDLGATINDFGNVPGPGTYFVGHVTFTIQGTAALGTYILQSAVNLPRASIVSSFDGTTFADNNLPAAQYMITIIPEPTTLALIGLTAVGGAILAHRRRVLRG